MSLSRRVPKQEPQTSLERARKFTRNQLPNLQDELICTPPLPNKHSLLETDRPSKLCKPPMFPTLLYAFALKFVNSRRCRGKPSHASRVVCLS